jgi:hypothetical protein
VYSDDMGNDLDSWTIQCEIVSHDFVGGGPPSEDPAPNHFDHLAPFDFFGLGQPGAGPVIPPQAQQQGGFLNQQLGGNQGLQQGQQGHHQEGNMAFFQGQGQGINL